MNLDLSRKPPGLAADIVDFAAQRLSGDVTVREARQFLAGTGAWGVPLVGQDGDYIGMLTLRSMVGAVLPVAIGEQAVNRSRLERELDRPAGQLIDLEVPVVRLSTKLPQLIAALCRRAPILPIVSDTGMRFLGIASLERAAHALFSR